MGRLPEGRPDGSMSTVHAAGTRSESDQSVSEKTQIAGAPPCPAAFITRHKYSVTTVR